MLSAPVGPHPGPSARLVGRRGAVRRGADRRGGPCAVPGLDPPRQAPGRGVGAGPQGGCQRLLPARRARDARGRQGALGPDGRGGAERSTGPGGPTAARGGSRRVVGRVGGGAHGEAVFARPHLGEPREGGGAIWTVWGGLGHRLGRRRRGGVDRSSGRGRRLCRPIGASRGARPGTHGVAAQRLLHAGRHARSARARRPLRPGAAHELPVPQRSAGARVGRGGAGAQAGRRARRRDPGTARSHRPGRQVRPRPKRLRPCRTRRPARVRRPSTRPLRGHLPRAPGPGFEGITFHAIKERP